MKNLVLFVIVCCAFAQDNSYIEDLVKPSIGHDEEDNHILVVTVRIGDYNRVIDTKDDEVIFGLRDEINPPINQVICNYLGEILNIDPKRVDVIEGHSENERKTVQIDGSAITAEQIQEKILKALRDCIEEERHLKPSIKHKYI